MDLRSAFGYQAPGVAHRGQRLGGDDRPRPHDGIGGAGHRGGGGAATRRGHARVDERGEIGPLGAGIEIGRISSLRTDVEVTEIGSLRTDIEVGRVHPLRADLGVGAVVVLGHRRSVPINRLWWTVTGADVAQPPVVDGIPATVGHGLREHAVDETHHVVVPLGRRCRSTPNRTPGPPSAPTDPVRRGRRGRVVGGDGVDLTACCNITRQSAQVTVVIILARGCSACIRPIEVAPRAEHTRLSASPSTSVMPELRSTSMRCEAM